MIVVVVAPVLAMLLLSPPPRWQRPPVSSPSASPTASGVFGALLRDDERDVSKFVQALTDAGPLSPGEWLGAGREARDAGSWRAAAGVARAALRKAPNPPLAISDDFEMPSSGTASAAAAPPPVRALFREAVACCADAGAWRAAVDLVHELEASGRKAGATMYTEAIRGCWRGGKWGAAVSLLHRARRRERSSCTVGMYAAAIAACDGAGRLDEAMRLYAEGVDAGIFRHWHESEPFSLDLHGFTQPTAACAVRHVLTHELGNFIPADLKIIVGQGKHADDGESRLGPRIERLLSQELTPPLPFDRAERLHCDTAGCKFIPNNGCLVVPVQHLFRWLVDSRPYESYYINLPGPGAA